MASAPEGTWPASVPPEACAELVEEAPVGIFLLREGRLVAGNRWMREFCGRALDEASPLDALEIVHPDDRLLVSRRLSEPAGGCGARPAIAARFLRGDGAVRAGELLARDLLLGGRPAIQGTLLDSTCGAEIVRGLQESAARLEQAIGQSRLFGDILSHDLMNPVWVAENYLRLLMDGGVPASRLPHYEGMRGALAKARSILIDARTYLRSQDRADCSREPVALGSLVEQTAQELRPQWEAKGQTVAFTLDAAAVCAAGPLLREVVWHLLSNAIQYGPPGSPIEVLVAAGPPVRLEVRDRGPGVPEAAREHIFQRFERRDKGSIAGVGLGLAIVRRLMGLYRGRVRVEDNPGGGSSFIVEIPAADG